MEQTIQQIKEVITPIELLKHWQGHRTLTRRAIETFPEKEFFLTSSQGHPNHEKRPNNIFCSSVLSSNMSFSSFDCGNWIVIP